jgi:hypothetical protein
VTEETTGRNRDSVPAEAAESGLWLLSLRSFLIPGNHPGTDGERVTSRDYHCETLVLREILLRCLLLSANLSGEATGHGDKAETPVGEEAGRAVVAPLWTEPDAFNRLVEGFKDVCALCDAAVAAGSVSFGTWSDIGAALIRILDNSEAAGALTQAARAPRAGHLRARLSALAESVSPEELSEDLLAVFEGFARLLDYLSFAEGALASDAPLKSLLAVFALLQEEGRELLDFVEQLSRGAAPDAALRDALDGTAYAIRMELRKSFEQELEGFCSAAGPAQTFSRAESASGLLRNCFQQSVVAIARSIDPTVEGAELFGSFQTRLDESLILRKELWDLIHFAREAERQPSAALAQTVAERLYAFRDGSLRYLMYKDREPFEKFLEGVETARGAAALGDVLHRLGAFLETLFGQVNMRAALVNHPFNPEEVGPGASL